MSIGATTKRFSVVEVHNWQVLAWLHRGRSPQSQWGCECIQSLAMMILKSVMCISASWSIHSLIHVLVLFNQNDMVFTIKVKPKECFAC